MATKRSLAARAKYPKSGAAAGGLVIFPVCKIRAYRLNRGELIRLRMAAARALPATFEKLMLVEAKQDT